MPPVGIEPTTFRFNQFELKPSGCSWLPVPRLQIQSFGDRGAGHADLGSLRGLGGPMVAPTVPPRMPSQTSALPSPSSVSWMYAFEVVVSWEMRNQAWICLSVRPCASRSDPHAARSRWR